jgi:ketosteroid isomerase-like protein
MTIDSTRLARLASLALGLAFGTAPLHAQGASDHAGHAAGHAAQHAAHHGAQAGDSAAVAATVERYHAALATGDSAAALALLAPDALVHESGGVETIAEYRAHHLKSDIEFARAVKEGRTTLRVTVRGDAAWTSATSTAEGEFRGRPVKSMGTELMVLVRTPAGWRITAIHWSSRRRA